MCAQGTVAVVVFRYNEIITFKTRLVVLDLLGSCDQVLDLLGSRDQVLESRDINNGTIGRVKSRDCLETDKFR